MNNQDIPQFFVKNNFIGFSFNSINTYLNNNGIEKKKSIGLPKWNQISTENYSDFFNKNDKAFAIITGAISNITVFDFDNADVYNEMIEEYPELKTAFTVQTKRGFHLYFNYDSEIKTTTHALKGQYEDIDIRNDKSIIYAPPTNYKSVNGVVNYYSIVNDCEFTDVPQCLKSLLNQNKKNEMNLIKQVKPSMTDILSMTDNIPSINQMVGEELNTEMEKMEFYVENGARISNGDCPHEDLVKVGYALNSSFGKKGLELYLQISKNDNHDYDQNNDTLRYNSILCNSNYNITLGTIYYLFKTTNPNKYNQITTDYQEKNDIFNGYLKIDELENNYELAHKISKTITKSLVYTSNRNWYSLNENNLWINVNPSRNLTKEILRYIDYNIAYYATKLNSTSSEVEKKKLISYIDLFSKRRKGICNEVSPIKKIKDFLEAIIIDYEFESKLDKNRDVMAFKNGILCLKTREFREGFRCDDYLTTHISFNYNKKFDVDKLKFLKEKITEIMNNDTEHFNYLMSIIGACFTGHANKIKEFYFCVDGIGGIGNNGKTFLFDILTAIFPNYVYKTNKTFLEATNTKSHKQLANMGGKKIVWCDEWSQKAPNYELIKTIADGNSEEYDVLFSTCGQLDILFKMFVLTNHTPNMSADEEAVYNRLRQITYSSHFDTQGLTSEIDVEKLKFIADPMLPELLKNEYKDELVELILQFSQKFILNNYKLPKIPNKFANDTKATKSANNALLVAIDELCEIEKDTYLSMKDLKEITGLKDSKELVKKMTQLGYEYLKDKKISGKKGQFCGLQLKDEDEYEEE